MVNDCIPAQQSWEEFASSLPRSASDTDRLMATVFFRLQHESSDVTDAVVVANEYFRRARWPRPSNLAATANHCAGNGWLTETGRADRRKLWRMTRKGHEYASGRFQN